MTAIVTPVPESLPTPAAPEISAAPTRLRYSRPLVAAAIIGLLALATLVAWQRGAPDRPSPTEADPLTASLQWMSEATLTFPGIDRSGRSSPAPFAQFSIQSVSVIDHATGPILAIGRATRPDGTVEDITYRVEVTRSGDSWAIEATRLSVADYPSVTPE